MHYQTTPAENIFTGPLLTPALLGLTCHYSTFHPLSFICFMFSWIALMSMSMYSLHSCVVTTIIRIISTILAEHQTRHIPSPVFQSCGSSVVVNLLVNF